MSYISAASPMEPYLEAAREPVGSDGGFVSGIQAAWPTRKKMFIPAWKQGVSRGQVEDLEEEHVCGSQDGVQQEVTLHHGKLEEVEDEGDQGYDGGGTMGGRQLGEKVAGGGEEHTHLADQHKEYITETATKAKEEETGSEGLGTLEYRRWPRCETGDQQSREPGLVGHCLAVSRVEKYRDSMMLPSNVSQAPNLRTGFLNTSL